jgi:DNA invertase Pin-like site-specific DNA recombinase
MRRSGAFRRRPSATAAVPEGIASADISDGSATRVGGSSTPLGVAAAHAGKADAPGARAGAGRRTDRGPTEYCIAKGLASSERYQPQAFPVLGYASMDPELGDSGKDFRGQAEKMASECERRGLSLLDVVRERVPKRDRALTRPGFAYALQQLSSGQAKGLVVADLSRLTRSVAQLGPVLAWLSRSDARLIAVAEGIDTAEPAGRLVARTLIEVSRWESQRLAERTRKGMRVARRKGPPTVADDPELKDRIARMRADGMTLQQIADQLNREGVPTVRNGAKWRPSSVQTAAGYRRPLAWERLDPSPRADAGGRRRKAARSREPA